MYERALLTTMADHNRWMNERLYAVCKRMRDEERRRNLGAFFGSVHGTFNHLLLVERLWLGRISSTPPAIESLDQELYADFDTLAKEHARADAELTGFIDSLEPANLAGRIPYTSFVKKTAVSLPLGVILIHLFHHQTHHRGQITSLISRLGYEYGDTDLIYMPGAGSMYFHDPADASP